METQTTNQPTCDKEQTKFAWSKKIASGVVSLFKAALRAILLRPATWRFLMVHAPEMYAKAESWIKEIAAMFEF